MRKKVFLVFPFGVLIFSLVSALVPLCQHSKYFSQNQSSSNIGLLTEATRTLKCSSFKVIATGDGCGYTIWDGNGYFLYNSLYPQEFSSCFETTQCYTIAPTSFNQDCGYFFYLNGTSLSDSEIVRSSKEGYSYYRVGACKNRTCGTDAELLLGNEDIDEGNINFTYIVKDVESNHKGTIQNGNIKSICMDMSKCNILKSEIEKSAYYLLTENNKTHVRVLKGFEAFGDCQTTCSDMTLLILASDGNFDYTIKDESSSKEKGQLSSGENKVICLESNSCTTVSGSGNAMYLLFKNGRVIDGEDNFEYRGFGTCSCQNLPVLSSTTRGREIVYLLSTISGMRSLADFRSFQYMSACWIINYDPRNLSVQRDFNIVQRYVLALLYFSTNGPNWIFNAGFLSSKNECEWSAVKCNEDGFITELILVKNNLVGSLVSEIQIFSSLEYFDFSFNELGGHFPNCIGLSNLKFFDISDNKFTGTLPANIFRILGVETLRLSRNLFTGPIPNVDVNLPSLKFFIAERNFLTGNIPTWIETANSLISFSLFSNQLTGTLPILTNLHSLETIYLDHNYLSGSIPADFFNILNISEVNLSHNQLTGDIPRDIESHSKIKRISMESNLLSGTIPMQLSSLKDLTFLDLSSNKLQGSFPYAFLGQRKLGYLKLEHNQITGTIPYVNCSQFSYLSADCDVPKQVTCTCCNRCVGLFTSKATNYDCSSDEISLQIFSFTNEYMAFSLRNEADEVILIEAMNTKSLNHTSNLCISSTGCYRFTSKSLAEINEVYIEIKVNGKDLFGKLPASTDVWFGYSANETIQPNTCDNLSICGTDIVSGTSLRMLVNEVMKFSYISEITKHKSSQYQSICWWLKDINRLEEQNLNNSLIQRYLLALFFFSTNGVKWTRNNLWLSQKAECDWFGIICANGIVNHLILNNNYIFDMLPSELGELRGLEYISLSSNELRGSLPTQLAKLASLKTLKVNNNILDGYLPTEFGFVVELETLDLSANKLTGTIPSELNNLNGVKSLVLAENSFSGELSTKISNMTKMRLLNVSNNLLQGRTTEILNFSDIEVLDLSLNYFSGGLPISSSNSKLQTARLNSNHFSGSIPSSISALSNLEELYLYDNEIRGTLPSQIGDLTQMSKLALSYNSIKGGIPPEIGKLTKLSLLQLQSNHLEGDADYFQYRIESFVADCGNTATTKSLVTCSQCTQCCNLEGGCTNPVETWQNLSSGLISFIILFSVWIIMLFYAVFLFYFRERLPMLVYRFETEFQSDSVYRFFLTKDIFGWLIALFSAAFQFWVLSIFFRAGDRSLDINSYVYSVSCPDDGLDCQNENQTTMVGWLTFSIIISFFTAPDIIDGILIYYDSCTSSKLLVRGLIAGFIVFSTPIMTIVASCFYLKAISITDAALLQKAVVIMFLSDMDEQLYKIFHIVKPDWVETLENQVRNLFLFHSRSRTFSFGGFSIESKEIEQRYSVKELKNENDEEILSSDSLNQQQLQVECKKELTDIASDLEYYPNALENKVEVLPTTKDSISDSLSHRLRYLQDEIKLLKSTYNQESKLLKEEIDLARERGTQLKYKLVLLQRYLSKFEDAANITPHPHIEGFC